MIDATLRLLLARFLFSLESRHLDEDSLENMKKWFYTHISESDFGWHRIEKELPLMIRDVDRILFTEKKHSVPWHSPDYIVWPILLKFAQVQSGSISV